MSPGGHDPPHDDRRSDDDARYATEEHGEVSGVPRGSVMLPLIARRAVLLLALGAIVALTLTAGAPTAGAQGPVKIGFLAPLSGAIAQAGKDMYSGCELYWEETGWQLAGRKLEVILEDNEGVPATTLTKARKLVESDRVNMLAGVILSNVAYALVPYVEARAFRRSIRSTPPTISPSASAPSGSSAPASRPAATCTRSGSTRPRRSATRRSPSLARLRLRLGDGGRLPQDLRGQRRPDHPADLGAAQRPGLRAVPGPDPRDADAVFVLALGRWSRAFAKQYADSGLEMPLIARRHHSDEHVLPQLGDESIGVISAHHYSAALDTPANRKFRAAFEKAYTRTPSFYSENCYTGGPGDRGGGEGGRTGAWRTGPP